MISTPCFSATSFAVAFGLTLNPIIIAFAAFARLTSDSFIAPAFECITFTATSLSDNFSRDCFNASAVP